MRPATHEAARRRRPIRVQFAVALTLAALAPMVAAAASPGATGRPAAPGAGTAPQDFFFVTPSRNIYCEHEPGGPRPDAAEVRCSIRTGLRPRPPRSTACPRDSTPVTDRVGVLATGRGHVLPCAGDAGPLAALSIPGVPVLSYGQTWRGPRGLSCVSRQAGLTCTNRQAHGFFVSRRSYRTF